MSEIHPIPASKKFKNLVGQTFGKLTVVEYAGKNASGKQTMWKCQCACGKHTVCLGNSIKTGRTRSCGCWNTIGQRVTTHGCTRNRKPVPEYAVWQTMIRRCTKSKCEKFAIYGARGISVCQQWLTSFECFLADMGSRPSPDHSIDRIDNDGNYEPGNCRWATKQEQQRNTRQNRRLTFDGETLCVVEWAEKLGINVDVLRHRLHRGWSVEKSLTQPASAPNRQRAHQG